MKRLIVCCDGTWNRADQASPTNVVTLHDAIAPCDGTRIEQRHEYFEGVGNGRLDRLRGGIFGKGLGAHVREAYAYVVDQFERDDEIYLFGFSRGAYTVRSLAGLIRNSGVLTREHRDKIDAAYRLYRRRDAPSHPRGQAARCFRNAYSHETGIHFIGVWDTVGALGIPAGIPGLTGLNHRRYAFHDTQCSSRVNYAYQALAIDERRLQFAPTLWTQEPDQTKPVMEQVWFAGVHSNVGGGCPDSGLSDLALVWMMEKARNAGLVFSEDDGERPVSPDALGALSNSKTWPYTYFRDLLRLIDDPNHCGMRSFQAVHPSAVERLGQMRSTMPPYAPSNLTDYLQRQGEGEARSLTAHSAEAARG